jgi:hypothetical protein
MAQPFAVRHHVLPDELLVVPASRLKIDLKLDALIHAIDAVDRLADRVSGAARRHRRR